MIPPTVSLSNTTQNSTSKEISSFTETPLYKYLYSGPHDAEGFRNGLGTQSWLEPIDQKYMGTFFYNNMHGNGTYCIRTEDNLDFFNGEMYDNCQEGYGVTVDKTGNLFEGLFKNNRRFGPGVLTHVDFTQSVGLWHGNTLLRLAQVIGHNVVPRLQKTKIGKIKLLRYRNLVPVCGEADKDKQKDVAKEILQSINAPPELIERSEELYNKHVRNKNSLFFNKKKYNEAFFGEEDCYIDVILDDKSVSLLSTIGESPKETLTPESKKTDQEKEEEKPKTEEASKHSKSLLKNFKDELKTEMHILREAKQKIIKQLHYCYDCCHNMHSSNSLLTEQEEEEELGSLPSVISVKKDDIDFSVDQRKSVKLESAHKKKSKDSKKSTGSDVSETPTKKKGNKKKSVDTGSESIDPSVSLNANSEDLTQEFSEIEVAFHQLDGPKISADTTKGKGLDKDGSTSTIVTMMPNFNEIVEEEKNYEENMEEHQPSEILFTCVCGKDIENYDWLLDREQKLSNDINFYSTVVDYLSEKLANGNDDNPKADTSDEFKTKKVLVTHLLAWNNDVHSSEMLKQCFRHRKFEDNVRFNVKTLLSGKRADFMPPGKHEKHCLEFLNECHKGDHHFAHSLILHYDLNPDLCDGRGNTGVFFAVATDRHQIIRHLANLGANLDYQNDECLTPLILALLRYLAVLNQVSDWEVAFLGDLKLNKEQKNEAEQWRPHGSFKSITELMLGNGPEQSDKSSSTNTSTNCSKQSKEGICVWRFTPKQEVVPLISTNDGFIFSTAYRPKNGDLKNISAMELDEAHKHLRKINQTINLLIKHGVSCNEGEVPMCPLLLAIYTKNPEIVKKLIMAGANINVFSEENLTPIHIACSLQLCSQNLDILKVLLKHNCNPNARTPVDHWKNQTEEVLGEINFMIELEGKTPLHMLCLRTDFNEVTLEFLEKMIEQLIEDGANCNDTYLGHNLLSLAVIKGSISLIPLILQHIKGQAVLDNDMGNVLTLLALKRYPNLLPLSTCITIIDTLVELGVCPFEPIDVYGNVVEFLDKEYLCDIFQKSKQRAKMEKDNANLRKILQTNKPQTKVNCNELMRMYLMEKMRNMLTVRNRFIATKLLYIFAENEFFDHPFIENLARWLTVDIAAHNLELLYNLGDLKYTPNETENILLSMLEFVQKHEEKSQKTPRSKKSARTPDNLQNIATNINYKLVDTNIIFANPNNKFLMDLVDPKYDVCYHCLRRSYLNLILCPNCNLVFFCSEECNKFNIKLKTPHKCKEVFYDNVKHATEEGLLEKDEKPTDHEQIRYKTIGELLDLAKKQKQDLLGLGQQEEDQDLKETTSSEDNESEVDEFDIIFHEITADIKPKKTSKTKALGGTFSLGDLAFGEEEIEEEEEEEDEESILSAKALSEQAEAEASLLKGKKKKKFISSDMFSDDIKLLRKEDKSSLPEKVKPAKKKKGSAPDETKKRHTPKEVGAGDAGKGKKGKKDKDKEGDKSKKGKKGKGKPGSGDKKSSSEELETLPHKKEKKGGKGGKDSEAGDKSLGKKGKGKKSPSETDVDENEKPPKTKKGAKGKKGLDEGESEDHLPSKKGPKDKDGTKSKKGKKPKEGEDTDKDDSKTKKPKKPKSKETEDEDGEDPSKKNKSAKPKSAKKTKEDSELKAAKEKSKKDDDDTKPKKTKGSPSKKGGKPDGAPGEQSSSPPSKTPSSGGTEEAKTPQQYVKEDKNLARPLKPPSRGKSPEKSEKATPKLAIPPILQRLLDMSPKHFKPRSPTTPRCPPDGFPTPSEMDLIRAQQKRIPKQYQYFLELLAEYFPDFDPDYLFMPFVCYFDGQLYYKFDCPAGELYVPSFSIT